MKCECSVPKVFSEKHPWLTNAFDYSAVESLEEFREMVADATLILAMDKNGIGFSPVCGLETLWAICIGAIPNQRLSCVAFVIDFASEQLEHLLAAVSTVKGYHEYNGGEEGSA